jgi:hypothetical protein
MAITREFLKSFQYSSNVFLSFKYIATYTTTQKSEKQTWLMCMKNKYRLKGQALGWGIPKIRSHCSQVQPHISGMFPTLGFT